MKKPTSKLSLQRETVRALTASNLEQVNGGSHVSLSPSTSVISVSTTTSVISRNPSGGSANPSGG